MKKPGIEVALQNARRQVVERPAGGRAAANRLQHRLEVQAGALAVEERLAHADDGAGHDDLVAELRVLARAGRALVDDGLAHALEEREHGLRTCARRRRP